MSFIYDVVVIGGGIVGLGVFNRLLLNGYKNILLVEKSCQVITGASAGNSGILHTGFDSTSGTLESALVKRGYELYQDFAKDVALPIKRVGAYMVAWTDEELIILKEVLHQAHKNGVLDVQQIFPETLYKHEPSLRPNALGAVFIPGESIVDPLTLPLILYAQAKCYGGDVRTNTEIIDGSYDYENKYWTLNQNMIHAKFVINCAGLFGDSVEKIRLNQNKKINQTPFTIQPRIGQFSVYAAPKTPSTPIKSIILPIPTKFTKGIIVYPNLFNQIIVGPTAETQTNRQHAPIQSTVNVMLDDKITHVIPNLAREGFRRIGSYTGIRPATEYSDYQIVCDGKLQWICCGGIRSTGLTASLAIGEYVCQQLQDINHFSDQLMYDGFSRELYDNSLKKVKNLFQLTEHGLQAKCFEDYSDELVQTVGDLELAEVCRIRSNKIGLGDEKLQVSHWLLKLAWNTYQEESLHDT